MANFPNFGVPDERDLSTGSNFNPRNTSTIPACPVAPGDGTGVGPRGIAGTGRKIYPPLIWRIVRGV